MLVDEGSVPQPPLLALGAVEFAAAEGVSPQPPVLSSSLPRAPLLAVAAEGPQPPALLPPL